MALPRTKKSMSNELLLRIEKADDIEVHVRIVKTGDASWLEIRDYIKSQEDYGRGVTIPIKNADQARSVASNLGMVFADVLG